VESGGYLRIVLRRWPAILVCLVVGLGSAYGITSGLTKSYQANSQVFIDFVGGNSVEQALQAAQLSSQLIQSYAFIAESSAISSQVQSQLGLSSPPSIGASNVPGTLLVDLTATESSPAIAQEALSAAMTAFARAVSSFQSGTGTSVIVKTVQPASASNSPVSPKKGTNLAYGGASGLLVGLILAAILEYLDKSFRDPSELEGMDIGPLLGEIPKIKGVKGLLADQETDEDALEAFAALRASLRFLDPEKDNDRCEPRQCFGECR
jgi:capsular polysaccharide biosynthesis protein